MKINITLPTSWQDLNEDQLRFVFELLAAEYTLDEIKTLCFFHFGGIRFLGVDDDILLCKVKKKIFAVNARQVAEHFSVLDWIGDIPAEPVRLEKIGRHHAANARLEGVSFSTFIILENLYQGVLHTKDPKLLVQMAEILYNAPGIKLTAAEKTSIFYWFASVKQLMGRTFHHFYSQTADASQTPLFGNIRQQLLNTMNAMIRALTGGDITKEAQVLAMDCWRALTELDAKAQDYEDLKRHSKSL